MSDLITSETLSLNAAEALPRRGFVLGSLAAGFAASVAPNGALLAQTITTDAAGLDVGTVAIGAGADKIPAYFAKPAGKTGLATVLVVQEIFGVHEHIRDLCRRLAKQGYLAVATELYVRQGDPSKYTSIPTLIKEVVAKVPDAQVMADLDATAAWAASHGGDAARLAITGFCWGGRVVWMYAAHNPAVKAGVAWYGRLTSATSPNTPRHPYDVAGALNAPVLGLYGGADKGIPQDTIDEMKRRLAAGNANAKASRFVVYPDAPHAFNADYRPSYRKEAAADGWRRMLDWFASHGMA
ncbi:MAG: dienelactone hydrolase family protein [Burkholderiaceae bacterium]